MLQPLVGFFPLNSARCLIFKFVCQASLDFVEWEYAIAL